MMWDDLNYADGLAGLIWEPERYVTPCGGRRPCLPMGLPRSNELGGLNG